MLAASLCFVQYFLSRQEGNQNKLEDGDHDINLWVLLRSAGRRLQVWVKNTQRKITGLKKVPLYVFFFYNTNTYSDSSSEAAARCNRPGWDEASRVSGGKEPEGGRVVVGGGAKAAGPAEEVGTPGAAVDDQAAGEGDWTETGSLTATGAAAPPTSDLTGSALRIHYFLNEIGA